MDTEDGSPIVNLPVEEDTNVRKRKSDLHAIKDVYQLQTGESKPERDGEYSNDDTTAADNHIGNLKPLTGTPSNVKYDLHGLNLDSQRQPQLEQAILTEGAVLPKSKLSLKEIRALAHSWGTPGHRFRFASLNSKPASQDAASQDAASQDAATSLNEGHTPFERPNESMHFNGSQAPQSLERYSDALTAQRMYVLRLESELNNKDQSLLISHQREKQAIMKIQDLEQKLDFETTKVKEISRDNSKLFHDLEMSYCEREKLMQRIYDLEKMTKELTTAKNKAEFSLRENITNLRKEIAAEQAAAHRIEIQRVRRELDARVVAEREAINAALKDSMELGRVLTNDAHTLRTQQRTLVSQLEHSQGTVRLLHSRLKRFERLGCATNGARRLVLKLAVKLFVRNCTLARLVKSVLLQFAQVVAVVRSALPPSQGMQAQLKAYDHEDAPLHKIALHTEFSQKGIADPQTSASMETDDILHKPNSVYELPLEKILSVALGKDPLLRSHIITTDETVTNVTEIDKVPNIKGKMEDNRIGKSSVAVANLDDIMKVIKNPTPYNPTVFDSDNKHAIAGNHLQTPVSSLGKIMGTTRFSLLPELELWSQDGLSTKLDGWVYRIKEILGRLSGDNNAKGNESDSKGQPNFESEAQTKMSSIISAASLLVEGGRMLEVASTWLIRRDAGHQSINRALASRITELLNENEQFRKTHLSQGISIGETDSGRKTNLLEPLALDSNINQATKVAKISTLPSQTQSKIAAHTALAISQAVERNAALQAKENRESLIKSAQIAQRKRVGKLNDIKRRAEDSSNLIARLHEANSQRHQGDQPKPQNEVPPISKQTASGQGDKVLDYRITDGRHHRNSPQELHLESLARMYASRLWRLHLRFPETMGLPEENDVLTNAVKSVNSLQKGPSREKKDFPSVTLARAPRMRAKNVSEALTAFPAYFPCAASTELPTKAVPMLDRSKDYRKARPMTAHPKPSNEEHRYMQPKHCGNVRYSKTPFYKTFGNHKEGKDRPDTHFESRKDMVKEENISGDSICSSKNLNCKSTLRTSRSNESLGIQRSTQGNSPIHLPKSLSRNTSSGKHYDEQGNSGKVGPQTRYSFDRDRSESEDGKTKDSYDPSAYNNRGHDGHIQFRELDKRGSKDDQFGLKRSVSDDQTRDHDTAAREDQGYLDQENASYAENDSLDESKEEELIAVVLQDYTPDPDSMAKAAASNAPLLAVQRGQTLLLLDYDKDIHNVWVYAVNELGERGFVPASYCKMYVASLI